MNKPNIDIVVSGAKQAECTYKNVVLKGNHSFASQLTKPNCIYTIKWDFDLGEEEVTIPENCVLKFEGGSLSNGTIVGNNTSIGAIPVKIFSTDISLEGTWNVSEVYPEWFGAVGDGITDDYDSIRICLYGFGILNLQKNASYKVLNPNQYSAALYLDSGYNVDGNGATIIYGVNDEYSPLFATVEDSHNIVFENINIDWRGDITLYESSDEYIDGNICIIGYRASQNSRFSNISCFSSIDKAYGTFVFGLNGKHSYNTIFEHIYLTHYNFGFARGIHYVHINDIRGTLRSNLMDIPNTPYYIGPTHLVYLASISCILTNVVEEGSLLDEKPGGSMYGATVQVQGGNNHIIKNIISKMKNVPALCLKIDYPHKNNMIDNIVCDCSDWEESIFNTSHAPVRLITYQDDKAQGDIINNVSINISNKNIVPLALAGEGIELNNCLIVSTANPSEDESFDCAATIATMKASKVDIHIFANDAVSPRIDLDYCVRNNFLISANVPLLINLSEGRGVNMENIFDVNTPKKVNIQGHIDEETNVLYLRGNVLDGYSKTYLIDEDLGTYVNDWSKNINVYLKDGQHLIYFEYGNTNQMNVDFLLFNLDNRGGNYKTCGLVQLAHSNRVGGFDYNRSITVSNITTAGCQFKIRVYSSTRQFSIVKFKIISL